MPDHARVEETESKLACKQQAIAGWLNAAVIEFEWTLVTLLLLHAVSA